MKTHWVKYFVSSVCIALAASTKTTNDISLENCDPKATWSVYMEVAAEMIGKAKSSFISCHDVDGKCEQTQALMSYLEVVDDVIHKAKINFPTLPCKKPPQKVINAEEEVIFIRPGQPIVKYRCKTPYVLEGSSQVECMSGEWTGQLPKCIDSRCYLKDLQSAENLAEETPTATNSGEKLNAICEAGYTPDEERPLCQNGTWLEKSISICIERCADPPPNVIHATVEIISTPEKKFAKYVCMEPYLLVGNSETPCLTGGWNGTAPICKDSRCYLKDLQSAENLAEETPTATNSGKKLYAICKAGYTPHQERPLCQNGTWVEESISICKETRCYLKDLRRAGNIAPGTPNITLSGDHLNVTCDEGHNYGPGIPFCFNGEWKWISISPCKESDNCNKMQQQIPDCSDLLRMGHRKSGVYTISPTRRLDEKKAFKVYCDMKTDGGGWTVIQRRGDFQNPVDYFYKDWKSYKEGFGDVEEEFWLGNDNIFALTHQGNYSVRFDLKDYENNKAYAQYESFWIDDESSNYTLHISNYSGDAGDDMAYHNNRKFSTRDQDNDEHKDYHCAQLYKGGWWFGECVHAHLNGKKLKGEQKGRTGIAWSTWKSYSLPSTEIKIRPKNFRT